MKIQMAAIAVLGILTTACATTSTMPRRQFEDIPIPTGMEYQPDRSVMIESPAVRAGQLTYRGRLEPLSLGDVMRSFLDSNGWQAVSRTASPSDTWLMYVKDGKALEVHIYEKLWHTYLTINASEVVPPAPAAAAAGPVDLKDGTPQSAQLGASPPATAGPGPGTAMPSQSGGNPTSKAR